MKSFIIASLALGCLISFGNADLPSGGLSVPLLEGIHEMKNNVPDENSRQMLGNLETLVIDLDLAVIENDLNGAIKILEDCYDQLKGLLQSLENQAYRDVMSKIMVENVATREKLYSGYGDISDVQEIMDYCTYYIFKTLNDESASSDSDWFKLFREVEAKAESKQASIIFEQIISKTTKLEAAVNNGDLTGTQRILEEKFHLENSLMQYATDKNQIILISTLVAENIAMRKKLSSTGNVDDVRALFLGGEAALKQYLAEVSISTLKELVREVQKKVGRMAQIKFNGLLDLVVKLPPAIIYGSSNDVIDILQACIEQETALLPYLENQTLINGISKVMAETEAVKQKLSAGGSVNSASALIPLGKDVLKEFLAEG